MSEPDFLTLGGAQRLAAEIMGHWRERGHAIKVRVVEEPGCDRPIYSVRSDLVRCLPPGASE